MSATVSGLFSGRDRLLEAIERLREAGITDLEAMSPAPDHEIEAALRHRPSRVGLITLAGGLFGMVFGFGGASLTHLHWDLITGGKPIVSVPPFVVVAFEMTILFGGLATLAGVILLTRLPRIKADEHYNPLVSEDHYVLIARTDEEDSDRAAEILENCGGEVRR